MNLFLTSFDPAEIAQNLDDKRLGSQLKECNQMMSIAIHRAWTNGEDEFAAHVGEGRLTKVNAHRNHPVTLWCSKNFRNFEFMWRVADACSAEWQHRYGRTHGSGHRTSYIVDNWTLFVNLMPNGDRTDFVNCAANAGLGLDFKHLPILDAYRTYLNARWPGDTRAPTWTNREAPTWKTL